MARKKPEAKESKPLLDQLADLAHDVIDAVKNEAQSSEGESAPPAQDEAVSSDDLMADHPKFAKFK